MMCAAKKGVEGLYLPTVYVISDSMGLTAKSLARAATSQFRTTGPEPEIKMLTEVRSFDQIEKFLEEATRYDAGLHGDGRLIVFYTLVKREIKNAVDEYAAAHPNIVAVDLITDAIDAISQVSGREPDATPGELYALDDQYFKRIDAIEFTIDHDDGRVPQDLPEADIVILGVSRTSKTPTSIYLGQQGYRVANVPLVPGIEIPRELFQVERSRLFGLMTTEEVLVGIRGRRLGSAFAAGSRYADPASVRRELENARNIMRVLGCKVINTENRAIEETAQEIIRLYDMAHSKGIPHANFE